MDENKEVLQKVQEETKERLEDGEGPLRIDQGEFSAKRRRRESRKSIGSVKRAEISIISIIEDEREFESKLIQQ